MNPTKTCESCHCIAVLYTMPNGQRLCDYCGQAWADLTNAKPVRKPREYNSTKWLIKQDHGTIRAWAKKRGFNHNMVSQILNKNGYYNVCDMEVMSDTHLAVLEALTKDGYGTLLVAEGYVNN